ncbi:hypothetical protein VP01_2984g2 [Puccinia sorghi]|uniref:Uncharacterized protein n=1 Tax=Puccinia sorghi TaxID=27349 RepID=A0A0L6V0N0_9BASI|nr:hypothetical protein VP01_2984g2 [Puccinia sorghi]
MSTSLNFVSEPSSTPPQKLSNACLPVLKLPGRDSNYLDWELVVMDYLKAANLDYVVSQAMPEKPTNAWRTDNKFVCAVITQTIETSNLCHIRKHHRDANRMRVFWIRKWLLPKIESDDMLAQIDTMAKYHKRLNLLVTSSKPLTPNNVHLAALLSSIPQDWLHFVSALMNQDGVKTKAIVQKQVARAGQTTVALLEDVSVESDYSGSELEVVASQAAVSVSTTLAGSSTGDSNIDSGCSVSMTPKVLSILDPKPDHTPVCLGDHSLVEANHRGLSKLPLTGDKSIKTLVEPSLHEPLLSVAGLCNVGITVVFTKANFQLYSSEDVEISATQVGTGYRQGNLYYLLSEPCSNSKGPACKEGPQDGTKSEILIQNQIQRSK